MLQYCSGSRVLEPIPLPKALRELQLGSALGHELGMLEHKSAMSHRPDQSSQRTGLSRLLRKAGWSVVDQGLSALTNLALSVFVARSVDAEGFGSFAVALLIYGIMVALAKSLLGQPLQIRCSAAIGQVRRLAIARTSGLALMIGVAAGLGCLVAGFAVPGTTGRALLALSVVMPGLLLQDTLRMAFFAEGRAHLAALIDTVWAIGQASIFAIVLTRLETGVQALILAWGAAAALSATVGLLLLRITPRLLDGAAWLREHYDLARYLLLEYLVGMGVFQVGILLVGAIAGASAVGAIRGAQVLLGLLGIVNVAAIQFAVPEVSRRGHLSKRQRSLYALVLSLVLTSFAIGYVALIALIPTKLGVQLLGDSWTNASPVLLPLGIATVTALVTTGPMVLLYGMGQARRTYRLNLIKAPVLVCTLALGTYFGGAFGSGCAIAATELATVPLWLLALRRALSEHESEKRPTAKQDVSSWQIGNDTGMAE